MDDDRITVPGAREASDVLRTDPIFTVLGPWLHHPLVLGAVLFILTVAVVILGPAAESRFIYTDF